MRQDLLHDHVLKRTVLECFVPSCRAAHVNNWLLSVLSGLLSLQATIHVKADLAEELEVSEHVI